MRISAFLPPALPQPLPGISAEALPPALFAEEPLALGESVLQTARDLYASIISRFGGAGDEPFYGGLGGDRLYTAEALLQMSLRGTNEEGGRNFFGAAADFFDRLTSASPADFAPQATAPFLTIPGGLTMPGAFITPGAPEAAQKEQYNREAAANPLPLYEDRKKSARGRARPSGILRLAGALCRLLLRGWAPPKR